MYILPLVFVEYFDRFFPRGASEYVDQCTTEKEIFLAYYKSGSYAEKESSDEGAKTFENFVERLKKEEHDAALRERKRRKRSLFRSMSSRENVSKTFGAHTRISKRLLSSLHVSL